MLNRFTVLLISISLVWLNVTWSGFLADAGNAVSFDRSVRLYTSVKKGCRGRYWSPLKRTNMPFHATFPTCFEKWEREEGDETLQDPLLTTRLLRSTCSGK